MATAPWLVIMLGKNFIPSRYFASSTVLKASALVLVGLPLLVSCSGNTSNNTVTNSSSSNTASINYCSQLSGQAREYIKAGITDDGSLENILGEMSHWCPDDLNSLIAELITATDVETSTNTTEGTSSTPATSESATTPPTVTKTPEPVKPKYPAGSISWDSARSYVGKNVVVCGPVLNGYTAWNSNGQPTFLDIGVAYPGTGGVTAIIWGDDLNRFSANPVNLYSNKDICVSGKLEDYKGSVQIKVNSPNKIETY